MAKHEMMKTYEDKELFDISAHDALFQAMKDAATTDPDAEDDIDYIEGYIKNIIDYVSVVDGTIVSGNCARARLEGEAYRQRIMELDRQRRITHEAAIASVSALERIAGMYGVSPLFTGDKDDRDQVADFCLEFVVKIYDQR